MTVKKGRYMYTKQNNMLIRQTLRLYGTPLWKLGKILGISESSVTRLMRDELPEEEQVRIISLIEKEEGKEGRESGVSETDHELI